MLFYRQNVHQQKNVKLMKDNFDLIVVRSSICPL